MENCCSWPFDGLVSLADPALAATLVWYRLMDRYRKLEFAFPFKPFCSSFLFNTSGSWCASLCNKITCRHEKSTHEREHTNKPWKLNRIAKNFYKHECIDFRCHCVRLWRCKIGLKIGFTEKPVFRISLSLWSYRLAALVVEGLISMSFGMTSCS